jgi:hypothetical protein
MPARPRPRQRVEPIQLHHLGPRATKSCTNFSLRVVAGVDLAQRAQLGVRAEHQVDAGAGPADRARLAVVGREHVLALALRRPGDAHVEQVDEEVVREHAGAVGEDAVRAAAGVGAEGAQAADEHGHLRRGQGEQLRLVDQQLLGRDVYFVLR